jgi:hypothetical protein
MKIFQLFFLSVILASCGTSKIQLVKTDNDTRVIVESPTREEYTTHKEKPREINTLSERFEESSLVSISPDNLVISSKADDEQIEELVADDETVQKVKSALLAERKAYSSRNQLITSTSTLPFTFLFPPIFLLSLIFFIIGVVNFGKANTARYITPEGERYVSSARIFLTISSAIITIIILLAALVLLFFFL